MPDDAVVFEPLPKSRSPRPFGSYGLAAALPVLRAKPNAWARVKVFDKSGEAAYVAHRINGGKHPLFGTDFEACVRSKSALYMRFVGDAEE